MWIHLALVPSIHSTCPFWPHRHYCLYCLLLTFFQYCRLQDISSGYWVLVLHFTRREAVRQIDELQHIATNLGRSETSLSYSQKHSHIEYLGNKAELIIKGVICKDMQSSLLCAGRAWLYLALSESSLESYLRLFQENQGLLQKYYFK